VIYLDTNYIVRYVTHDDAVQTKIAIELLDNHDVFVCNEVITEVVFILHRKYGITRADIADFFLQFEQKENVNFSDVSIVLKAFEIYATNSKLDIVDCFLAAYHAVEQQQIATFDKALLRQIVAA